MVVFSALTKAVLVSSLVRDGGQSGFGCKARQCASSNGLVLPASHRGLPLNAEFVVVGPLT